MAEDHSRIKIKAARETNLEELKDLMKILCYSFNTIFYEKPWVMDMKYRIETNPASVIIAEDTDNKKIIGMIIADSGRDFYSGAILGQIVNFIIHPDYRGLKIGTQLVERALEYLELKNCRIVRTNSRPELKNVVALFDKFEFRKIFDVLEKKL